MIIDNFIDVFQWSFISINSFDRINYNCNQVIHILLFTNNQINISMFKLQSDALPRVKRNLVIIPVLNIETVHMFPEHPESRWEATANNSVDVTQQTGCARLDIIIKFLFFFNSADFIFAQFLISVTFFLVNYHLLYFHGVGLQNILWIVKRLLVSNDELLLVQTQLNVRFEGAEVLNCFLQCVIEFITWDYVVLEPSLCLLNVILRILHSIKLYFILQILLIVVL